MVLVRPSAQQENTGSMRDQAGTLAALAQDIRLRVQRIALTAPSNPELPHQIAPETNGVGKVQTTSCVPIKNKKGDK